VSAPSPWAGNGVQPRQFATEGERFGRLKVLSDEVVRVGRDGRRAALCRCDCGTEKPIRISDLFSGNCQSCGCLFREARVEASRSPRNLEQLRQMAERRRTHGLWDHPLYGTWLALIHRCENPSAANFKYYGARGIRVCAEWHDVAVFVAWIEANLGPRPEGMTLDRVNVNRHYEPGNVQWATAIEQRRNRRDAVDPQFAETTPSTASCVTTERSAS